MNLNSRLFDRIRTRPRRAESGVAPDAPACEHPGCAGVGDHRAPKGRGQEGHYWRFCLDHVRAYNQSFNYFAGMSDDAIVRYQKDAMVGHRPTWHMGAHGRRTEEPQPGSADFVCDDPLGVFRAAGFAGRSTPEPPKPAVGPVAQRAYETLGLDATADPAAVKARYKFLVKQVHPDANGGDRSLEDRLRDVITAYNTLKAAGRA